MFQNFKSSIPESLSTVCTSYSYCASVPIYVLTLLSNPAGAVTFGSNYSSTNQARRLHSLLSSFCRRMIPHVLPPGFSFSATLFTTLCLVIVNSQSLTTTWHAYHQNHVKAKQSTKACERYYNSSRPQSALVLENNNGSSAGLSELRLWPGKVALLQL